MKPFNLEKALEGEAIKLPSSSVSNFRKTKTDGVYAADVKMGTTELVMECWFHEDGMMWPYGCEEWLNYAVKQGLNMIEHQLQMV